MNNPILSQYEYARQFWNYAKGNGETGEAIQKGRTRDTGTYYLPTETEEKYEAAIEKESIFREVGSVFKSYDSDSKIFAADSDDICRFVLENGTISVVDLTDDFTKIPVQRNKLATLFRASYPFINDSAFDFESYLVKRMARAFGGAEDNAFINGNGEIEPIGILHDSKGAETAATVSTITYDDIVHLYFSVKPKYRKNAVWMMNDETAMVIRKLKDEAGNLLWNDTNGTILGKRVVISEYMPNIGVGAKPIAFGDFGYYWIVKRSPVTVKTIFERFILNDQIGFLGFEFIDGRLIRRDAVKVISIAEQTE